MLQPKQKALNLVQLVTLVTKHMTTIFPWRDQISNMSTP